MVHPPTQQTVDRIVGTVAVLGLSVAAIRWLAHTSKQRRSGQHFKKLPWWWPVIALRRRKGRRERGQCCDVADDEERCDLEQSKAREKNLEGGYEHRGSCHCRSIHFLLRGPKNLQAVDSPGKIRYPHIPTTASQFELLRGENDMRFYYVNVKADSASIESSIASEEPNYCFESDDDIHNNNRTQQQSSGAHGFCGNCGVHVLRAPSRSSEDLEINANCLEDGGKASCVDVNAREAAPLARSSTSSLTSNGAEGDMGHRTVHDQGKVRSNTIETVDENEALLGGHAYFWESLDDRPPPPEPYVSQLIANASKNESDSMHDAQPLTQSVTESDDYSMGSSSLTATSSLHMLSVASGGVGISFTQSRAGLPPLHPSSGSIKTLPPRFGESRRTRYGGGRSLGAGLDSSWSIASMESHDLDGETEKSNVSLNQMKYYMSRHMAKEK
ncbi:hypothetical protein HJC23_010005 [Cyclotella cryptica]|uniref:Uncharacterized protein n=1 Tax=Cyclotella cryptica TaxID=29204 RepID=A0ABD3Q979_9STRA|eukprot:CCRYP_007791-RA/>CCRYP_007791-RA protein AED:0.03 eAED:0.03 QI:70/1/1/1/1/1/2/1527/442